MRRSTRGDRDAITTGLALAEEKRFFHWDLEFPEVFYDAFQRKENGGFDAVVGNPPYVDLKGMDPVLVKFYFTVFPPAENRINIFAFFENRGFDVVKEGNGTVGFIIPTSMLVQESYQKIRRLMLESSSIMQIVRLPSEMFGEAAGDVKVDTMILCLRRQVSSNNVTDILIYSGFTRVDLISPSTASNHVHVLQSTWLENEACVISLGKGEAEDKIVRKLRLRSVKLEDLCDFTLGFAIRQVCRSHSRPDQEQGISFSFMQSRFS